MRLRVDLAATFANACRRTIPKLEARIAEETDPAERDRLLELLRGMRALVAADEEHEPG